MIPPATVMPPHTASEPADALPDAHELPLSSSKRHAFERFLPRALDVLADRHRALRTARLAYKRLSKEQDGMKRVAGDFRVLIRLLSRSLRGEYKLPWKSTVFAMGALLYFLSPLDLIPDFLIGIGYVDDVAVVFGVLSALREDLNRFVAWEASAHPAPVRPPRRKRAKAVS